MRDLTAALYSQLGVLVEKQAVLRQCRGCHHLFYPRRSNQEYCDRHCGTAARQREYYKTPKYREARMRAREKGTKRDSDPRPASRRRRP